MVGHMQAKAILTPTRSEKWRSPSQRNIVTAQLVILGGNCAECSWFLLKEDEQKLAGVCLGKLVRWSWN